MQFKLVSLALFSALALAQTNGTSTDLATLVAQLPKCALKCFQSAATSVNCAPTSFTCLCDQSKRSAFTTSIGGCLLIGTGGCSSDDTKKLTTLAGQICTEATDNPTPADIASASNIITAALGSATASTSSPGNAPARPTLGVGMMGAVALAALAL